MLRTDDIAGAQPKRFTHAEKGHVQPQHASSKLKHEPTDPKPNAKGLESPFALYGTFDPTSSGQKVTAPESTKIVRRNVSMQIKSLLAPELERKSVKGNHQVQIPQGNPHQELQNDNGNTVGFKLLPLRSNSQLSRSASQKEDLSINARGSSNNAGFDSIDMLRNQVSEKFNTPGEHNTPLKKALHNFYGVTPPDSRNSSYYRNFEIKRGGNTGNNFNGMSDSYYQNKTSEIQERAQQNTGFNRAYKNFYGVTLNDSESFKPNQNQLYKNSITPGGLPDKYQAFTQSNSQLLQHQVEQRLQQQRPYDLQIQANLNNSTDNLKFTLDPISHEKVYAVPSPYKRGNLAKLSQKM